MAPAGPGIEASVSWVGIGGFGNRNLVQAGLMGQVSDQTSTIYSMWWEMLPLGEVPVTLTPDPILSPGDLVYAHVSYAGLSSGVQSWRFSLGDSTTASGWTGSYLCNLYCYPSTFASAEWIVESPLIGRGLVQMPAFSAVDFQSPSFQNAAGTWASPEPGATNVTALLQANGAFSPAVTGVVSNLTTAPSGFYVDYLAVPQSTGRNGTCCSFTPRIGEAGQRIEGNLTLFSPDNLVPSASTTLALTIDLTSKDGAGSCEDLPDAHVGFDLASGYDRVDATLRICSVLPYGEYRVSFELWFVPSGGTAGSAGSLRLSEVSGPGDSSIFLEVGPTVGSPFASPGSGRVDAGQAVRFNVTETGGIGPFRILWSGLPPGCPDLNVTWVRCENVTAGTYWVFASVQDSLGVIFEGPALSYLVDPGLTAGPVAASTELAYSGQDLRLAVTAMGGSMNWTYSWNGLPRGCLAVNASMIECHPLGTGRYTPRVNVSDSNGEVTTALAPTIEIVARPGAAISMLSGALVLAAGTGVCILTLLVAFRRNDQGPAR